MSGQFAAFQALYEQSCQVAATQCDQSYTIWRLYLTPALLALGLAVYWWSGSALRLAGWATGWTQRGWLRAMLVTAPPVAAWIGTLLAVKAWQYWDKAAQCSFFRTAPDGSRSCLEGSKPFAAVLTEVALESLWLWPVAALLAGVAVVLLRLAPRWWWLLPSLLWGGYLVVQEARIPGHLAPLTDERLLSVVAPMAEREGLSRDRLLTSRSFVDDFFTTARVDGIGSGQTIMFGFAYGNALRNPFGTVSKNGFHLPKLSDAALRAVMGHELAHIRKNHTAKRLTLSLLLIALLCWFAGRLSLRTLGHRSHPDDQDVTARWSRLALLSATLPVLFIVVDAANRCLSLALELEADRVGLEISREPDGFAEFALLDAAGGRFELGWRERWMTYHPSNADRVRLSIRWQQRHRPREPLAIPDTQRLLIPADRPYPAQP